MFERGFLRNTVIEKSPVMTLYDKNYSKLHMTRHTQHCCDLTNYH